MWVYLIGVPLILISLIVVLQELRPLWARARVVRRWLRPNKVVWEDEAPVRHPTLATHR